MGEIFIFNSYKDYIKRKFIIIFCFGLVYCKEIFSFLKIFGNKSRGKFCLKGDFSINGLENLKGKRIERRKLFDFLFWLN